MQGHTWGQRAVALICAVVLRPSGNMHPCTRALIRTWPMRVFFCKAVTELRVHSCLAFSIHLLQFREYKLIVPSFEVSQNRRFKILNWNGNGTSLFTAGKSQLCTDAENSPVPGEYTVVASPTNSTNPDLAEYLLNRLWEKEKSHHQDHYLPLWWPSFSFFHVNNCLPRRAIV